MKRQLFISVLLVMLTFSSRAAGLLVETESFTNKGGWVVDQQFMDLMGSPYLLAHGLGNPVSDVHLSINIEANMP